LSPLLIRREEPTSLGSQLSAVPSAQVDTDRGQPALRESEVGEVQKKEN